MVEMSVDLNNQGVVKVATSLDQILDFSRSNPSVLCVLNFWASWAEPCQHMNEVFSVLASTHSSVSFWSVEAEVVSDLSLHFMISAVPTFILLKSGKELERINGAKPDELVTIIENELNRNDPTKLNARLVELINKHPFMIFIKGTPNSPKCGFTMQLLQLLKEQGVTDYDYFDILSDEGIRQGLKVFSNWPTYPQIYIKGELVGGLDILREMAETNQLTLLIS